MQHGHCQTSGGESHSLPSSRQSQPFQSLGNLYTQMMRKCLQMLAGHFHIFQMVAMIQFKLLLMQVSVPILWNFYCGNQSPTVLLPALRTVGNIVTGDDMQTQCLVNLQVLPCLWNLLTHNHKRNIKKEACWAISNITAGNKNQIQAVIEAGVVAPIIHLLQSAEFEIKKEAAWTISNATSGGTHEQIKYLVKQGCIKPLCDLLVCPDPRTVSVCLEGLDHILKVGESEKNLGNSGDANLYAQLMDDADGLEKIENLQCHDNNEIYEKAVKILEAYWADEDDAPLRPSDTSNSGFSFGANELPVPSGGFNFCEDLTV